MCIQEQLNQTELHFWALADSLLLIYKATGWQQRNSWCATTVQMVLWKKKMGPNALVLVQFPVIWARSCVRKAHASCWLQVYTAMVSHGLTLSF